MRRAYCILAAFIMIAVFLAAAWSNLTGNIISEEKFSVAKVIDGDTIRLSTGEKVRFLNIDTPEIGQYLQKEATARMKELIGNSSVTLESDITNRDRYGRLLRYVYENGTMLNLIMVREGYARAYFIPPDDKHLKEIQEAEAYARSRNLGIWQYDNITGAFCIWVYELQDDPKGHDEENLNGEYVVFRNSCNHSIDLAGWKVSAERGSFIFPEFALQAKKTVTLHTGTDINNETDVYWGSPKPIWKNEDDTLLAYNAEGQIALDYTY